MVFGGADDVLQMGLTVADEGQHGHEGSANEDAGAGQFRHGLQTATDAGATGLKGALDGGIQAAEAEDDPATATLKEKLKQPLTVDFVSTPLDDVVAFLRSYGRVNIVVDKKAVADKPQDVSLTLKDVTIKEGLEWIVEQLGLEYTLQDGVIYISSSEEISKTKKTVTRYYDVTDLTLEIKNFKPNLEAISSEGLDVDDMTDIFSGDGEGEDVKTDQFTGESLVEFIKTVVEPGSWTDIVPSGGDDDGGGIF